MNKISRILSFLSISIASFSLHAGQTVEFSDTADPSIQNSTGNCPSGYLFRDLNIDGLEQNGECWRGVVVKDGKMGVKTLNPNPNFALTVGEGPTPGHASIFSSRASATFVAISNTTTSTGKQWYLSSWNDGRFVIHDPGVADRLSIDKDGAVTIGQVGGAGQSLNVNGPIYQRGGLLHADYVFKPSYKLESIEEHANFMWKNHHLTAIPKSMKDEHGQEVVEYGSHQRGIVEELEKSHIYIHQLSEKIKQLEEKLARIDQIR